MVNGVMVSVTSSGLVETNSLYCNATRPFTVGYNALNITPSGTGSYTFNFSPPIPAAMLNFSGLSNSANGLEEIRLFVNGTHYQIPSVGAPGCDSLAVLTPLGNMVACAGCVLSGWNGTQINGPISSITVMDTLIFGSSGGAIFSIFICDSILSDTDQMAVKPNYKLFPNPFSVQTTLQTDLPFKNATLLVYNAFGQPVKAVKNISGQSFTLSRDDLSKGLYLLRLMQDNLIIVVDKLVVTD